MSYSMQMPPGDNPAKRRAPGDKPGGPEPRPPKPQQMPPDDRPGPGGRDPEPMPSGDRPGRPRPPVREGATDAPPRRV